VRTLQTLLLDWDSRVRRSAAEALGKIDPEVARKAGIPGQ
jgi:HEAT repeat protein